MKLSKTAVIIAMLVSSLSANVTSLESQQIKHQTSITNKQSLEVYNLSQALKDVKKSLKNLNSVLDKNTDVDTDTYNLLVVSSQLLDTVHSVLLDAFKEEIRTKHNKDFREFNAEFNHFFVLFDQIKANRNGIETVAIENVQITKNDIAQIDQATEDKGWV